MTMYSLHNVSPTQVAAPTTPQELAETLREASAHHLAVVPWGGGTRQQIGLPPERYDLALLTTQLGRVIAYDPAEGVISVEAGMTLAALQAVLAEHGQWLPWDPPLPEQATVGGLLASAALGSLCFGYKQPREWTLGLRVAQGDGRLVQIGSRIRQPVSVLPNHTLHLGALGSLGVIVEASFKLAPLPEHRQTLLAAFTRTDLLEQAVRALRTELLQPIAIVMLNATAEAHIPPLHAFLKGQPNHIVVVAHFAGNAALVARQLRLATQRCIDVGARTVELREEDDGPLWAAIANLSAPVGDGSLCLRAALPGQFITRVANQIEREAVRHGYYPQQMVIVGPNHIFSRWTTSNAEPESLAESITSLRSEILALGGQFMLEEAPLSLKRDHGAVGHADRALVRSLWAEADPAGILNPGRYA